MCYGFFFNFKDLAKHKLQGAKQKYSLNEDPGLPGCS